MNRSVNAILSILSFYAIRTGITVAAYSQLTDRQLGCPLMDLIPDSAVSRNY